MSNQQRITSTKRTILNNTIANLPKLETIHTIQCNAALNREMVQRAKVRSGQVNSIIIRVHIQS